MVLIRGAAGFGAPGLKVQSCVGAHPTGRTFRTTREKSGSRIHSSLLGGDLEV